MSPADEHVLRTIVEPDRLWTRDEVRSRPSPVPAAPGVYGWYFREIPWELDTTKCVRDIVSGATLLYVGIAPREPVARTGQASKQTLRKRLRTHTAGNASASTLRLTLGLLLGLTLQPTASGRLTFGAAESELSQWMSTNALVTFAESAQPWIAERTLLGSVNLPLNLRDNQHHPFWSELSALRRSARRAALDAATGA